MSVWLTSLSSSVSSLFGSWYPGWLDTLFFQRWPGAWLQKEPFEAFTVALSIGLSLGAAGLLMYEQRARKLGERYPEHKARRIGIAFTVIAFLLYFDFFN